VPVRAIPAGCSARGGLGDARRLWLYGAVALCALLFTFTPSVRAAEALGGIEGQVTAAPTRAPVQGIEVCAITTNFELLGEEESEYQHVFACTKTGADGEYKVTELDPGTYYVDFVATAASGLNYLPQIYDDKLELSEATQVTVTAEKATPEIDAELSPGGEMAGTVTDALTGAPVGGAIVCALKAGPTGSEPVGCAIAEANGEYTIRGLPTGSYKLGFLAPGFETEYYKDKTSEAEAEVLSVTAPQLISGIDETLAPGEPGPSETGSTSPTSGSPTAKLPGASGTQSSSAPETTVSLIGTRISVVRNGDAMVKLACSDAAACSARLILEARRLVKVNGKKLLRTVTIGKSAILSIGAGKRLTATIQLDSAARRLLRAHHGQLQVHLTLATLGGKQDDRVVLVEQKRRGSR
jgi:hypothetical protein